MAQFWLWYDGDNGLQVDVDPATLSAALDNSLAQQWASLTVLRASKDTGADFSGKVRVNLNLVRWVQKV